MTDAPEAGSLPAAITRRALLIIDVQNDFTEGGALAVVGGAAVASKITEFLKEHRSSYSLVAASRDWHDGWNDNGGHFAVDVDPDFVNTWPRHCVAGSQGADYHPSLDIESIEAHVEKGQGVPAYSIFEGSAVGIDSEGVDNGADEDSSVAGSPAEAITDDGDFRSNSILFPELLRRRGITDVDVVGIATDYCVRASALDAISEGYRVRVFTDLVVGVSLDSSVAALAELEAAGVIIAKSSFAHQLG